MKVLCVTSRCDRPSVRFRIAQTVPYFESRGHAVTIVELPPSVLRRWPVYRSMRDFDVVLIQQRLFSPWEVQLIRKASRVLVFDFDDAVMFESDGHTRARRLRRFRAIW
jgi:hypothetical protein